MLTMRLMSWLAALAFLGLAVYFGVFHSWGVTVAFLLLGGGVELALKRVDLAIAAVVGAALVVGVSTWRQYQAANRAEAWFEEEFGALGKTIDEILSREGTKPNHTISGAISWRIEQKVSARGERSLTEAERTFGAVYWLEAEVNNGGFDQYFFNSAGNYAAEALAGLKAIGAFKTAALLERAMAVFPGNPPTDRRQRQETMQRIAAQSEPVWEQCSSEFYKLTESLSDLLVAFAKKKRTEFVFQ